MMQKQENRGGKRAGAGRRPADMSKTEVLNLVKAFRKMAKLHGKTVDDILAEISYNPEENTRYRLKAIEIYKSCTVTKHSHQVVEKIEGPQIMLPPLQPKPKPDNYQEQVVH